MQAENSEKFIAISYVTWCSIKTVVLFSVLLHFGQMRYKEIDGLYRTKEICQGCRNAAAKNTDLEFEFSRCAASFDVPADKKNLHKAAKNGWNWDGSLARQDNYVILPGVFLAFGVLMWALIFFFIYQIPNGRLTLLLTFVWNFFTAFLVLYCTSIIFMLYLKDFGNGVKCYVHVVDREFTIAVSGVIISFVAVEVVRWCCLQPGTFATTIAFLIQMLIMFVLMVLYTTQAGIATQKSGIYASAILAVVSWQVATEVPALAVICKTLFDLSSALQEYGFIRPYRNLGDDGDEEGEGAGLLRGNQQHQYTGRVQ